MKTKNIIFFSLIILTIFLSIGLYFYFKKENKNDNLAAFPLKSLREELEIANLDSSENLTEIALFFEAWAGSYLLPERRKIFNTISITDQAKQAIIELIKGPTKNYLLPTIPRGTSLRELYLEPEGTAHIDLSQQLIEKHWGGSRAEIITIYSIINTLTVNFPSIQQVKILVEGKDVDSLAGHISLRKPFRADFSLIGYRGSPEQETTTSKEVVEFKLIPDGLNR